jgi:hypothetical protein
VALVAILGIAAAWGGGGGGTPRAGGAIEGRRGPSAPASAPAPPPAPTAAELAERAAARRAQALRAAVDDLRAALKGDEAPADAVRRLAAADATAADLEPAEALAAVARSAIAWAGEPRLGPVEPAAAAGRARATVVLPIRRLHGPDPEAIEDWPVEFVEAGGRFQPKLGGPAALAGRAAVLWLDRLLDANRRRNDDVIREEMARAVTARGHPPGSALHDVAVKKLLAQARAALFVGSLAPGLRYAVEGVEWDAAERVADCRVRFEREPGGRPRDGEASGTVTLQLALRSGAWVWWGGDREPRRPVRPFGPGKRGRDGDGDDDGGGRRER